MSRQVTFKGKPLDLIGPELKPGMQAPDFACAVGLDIFTLAQTPAKARMFSVVPSLDTAVCSEQTRRFDTAIAGLLEKSACYTVSLDMPFAQKRFCTVENVCNMQNLSDLHDHSFGKNYGVLIEGLAIPLLCRAIFVVDKEGKIAYCEYVPEVATHPNYDKAIEALNAAV